MVKVMFGKYYFLFFEKKANSLFEKGWPRSPCRHGGGQGRLVVPYGNHMSEAGATLFFSHFLGKNSHLYLFDNVQDTFVTHNYFYFFLLKNIKKKVTKHPINLTIP